MPFGKRVKKKIKRRAGVLKRLDKERKVQIKYYNCKKKHKKIIFFNSFQYFYYPLLIKAENKTLGSLNYFFKILTADL